MRATHAVLLLTAGCLSLAGAAVLAGGPPAPAPAPAAGTPVIRSGLFYPAPGAAPFSPGTAPGVWVRDVPPDAPPPAARAVPAPPGGTGAGFYSPRMTYLMPDGRCASGPPRACVKPAPAKAGAARAVPGKTARTVVKAKARAAAKGGRK